MKTIEELLAEIESQTTWTTGGAFDNYATQNIGKLIEVVKVTVSALKLISKFGHLCASTSPLADDADEALTKAQEILGGKGS